MTASPDSRYPHLFAPMTLGAHRLKNRIVFPAIVNNFARQGLVTDRTVTFYAERAAGGAAMVVSEGLFVHRSSLPPSTGLAAFDPYNVEGFRRIAGAVEEHDSRMVGQLLHLGRQQLWTPGAASPLGVSAKPDPYRWTVPHAMSASEIEMVVEAFVTSAATLRRAGFSGVEVHAAHGHLITQFLSPWSNDREDGYGGDLDGRTRFLREVLAGIRSVCGKDFLLGLKMPGDELVKGGITPPEAVRIAQRVTAETMVDYLAFGQGNSSLSFGAHVPDMHYPPGPFLDIQRELRAAVPVPVVAFGRVTSADESEAVVRDGVGDLVGLGRVLLADPGFPAKVRDGHEAQVRPCIFCNVCWAEATQGRKLVCVVNPRLATPGEAAGVVRKVSKKRRITVVGAGVAGLQTATEAAARGHDVTLLAGSWLGGKARLEASLPGRQEVARVLEYQRSSAAAQGVRIEPGVEATAEMILASRPDAVVLATGARMVAPYGLEAGSETGISVRDYLAREDEEHGGTAVLFDFDHSPGTYAAVDLLTRRHRRVLLLTPRAHIGEGVPYVSLLGIHRRLHEAGVEIIPSSEPLMFKGNVLRYANVFTGVTTEVEEVRLFTWSTPRLPNDELVAPLESRVVPVHTIGDAYAPRTMLAAIHEAEQLAGRL
ncbi:FAD-dependent oxidoreductase [Amycolatopsis japonica]|uniref:oxidoreductase n=1 Tax=Amycolatopsis japonica TaxID=208439 RepID=UPI00366C3F3C